MSWKLDNIDFKNYGVTVAKSAGVLDMPRIIDTSTDWLDQNGRDYWQDAGEVKYQAREIALSCWIKATSYAEFKTRVTAFFAALVAPGERTLVTPFGNSVARVTVQQSVQMVRKAQYVSSLQMGAFTLRLTVAGDSQTKLQYIYHPDWAEGMLVAYGSDAKISRQFQGNSEITFRAEFNATNALGRGLYLTYNGNKYISLEYPEIYKESSNKIVYSLKFTHQFFVSRDVPFFVIDNPETFWYANMSEVMDMFVTNMNAAHPFLFAKGVVDATERRNHTFSNENCLDVLVRIAAVYELEWIYSQYPQSGLITVSVRKQIGLATEQTFEYGVGKKAYKIKRVPTPREKLCTKLYAYGSDKNIPATYGYPRLRLAAPIDRPYYDMKMWRVKTYPDIFPEHTGTVTSFVKNEKQPTWAFAPGTEGLPNPMKIYTFYPDDNTCNLTDTTMFDLKEKDVNGNTKYWLVGTNPKIRFNTGDVAGFEFEVTDYDHATKTFKILPYKDEAGKVYPSAVLFPKLGDLYKILDINPPDGSIAAAELKLYNAAYSDMFDGVTFNPTEADYVVETNPAFYSSDYTPGSTVMVVEPNFSLNALLRITEITSSLYTNESTITLSPGAVKSKRQNLEIKVKELDSAVTAAKLNDVDQTRGNTQTTSELKNTLVDPVDEKLRAADVIRRRSIDPVMLSDDAGIPQFSVKDALVEVDVDDIPNKIRINVGAFLSHNFYSVDRKTIKTIKAL